MVVLESEWSQSGATCLSTDCCFSELALAL